MSRSSHLYLLLVAAACADARSPGALDGAPKRDSHAGSGQPTSSPSSAGRGTGAAGSAAPRPVEMPEPTPSDPADPVKPDCSFSGEPRIEPADAEISSAQRFTLTGIAMLPAGCVTWSSSPSAFDVYNSTSLNRVMLDRDSGALSVHALPNDVELRISANVEGKAIATTQVRYYDPARALSGVLHEVAVLRCPDHAEMPSERIQEVIFDGDFKVTFQAFETYVDYWGSSGMGWDPDDPRRGAVSFDVEGGNFVPETLEREGRWVARPDGRVELRNLWLGPGAAECGHVLERYK